MTRVTRQQFIVAWQDAASNGGTRRDVTKSLGLKMSTVKRYAWAYRKREIPLARLADEEGSPDWERLRRLASDLAPPISDEEGFIKDWVTSPGDTMDEDEREDTERD